MEVVLDKRWLCKSGYSVILTLPKGFCTAHGWKPGDAVKIKTDGRRLIIEKEEGG